MKKIAVIIVFLFLSSSSIAGGWFFFVSIPIPKVFKSADEKFYDEQLISSARSCNAPWVPPSLQKEYGVDAFGNSHNNDYIFVKLPNEPFKGRLLKKGESVGRGCLYKMEK